MRVCNAGQPNLQEHVPRVSLIYRSAPVIMQNAMLFGIHFAYFLGAQFFNFFFSKYQIQKNVLAMIYF